MHGQRMCKQATWLNRSSKNVSQLPSRPLKAPVTAECIVGPAPARILWTAAHSAAKCCWKLSMMAAASCSLGLQDPPNTTAICRIKVHVYNFASMLDQNTYITEEGKEIHLCDLHEKALCGVADDFLGVCAGCAAIMRPSHLHERTHCGLQERFCFSDERLEGHLLLLAALCL